MKNISDIIKDYVFCVNKEDGEGFINKNSCDCYKKGIRDCNSIKERNYFHKRYSELEQEGLSRNEILDEFEKEFKGKEMYWYPFNVIR